MAEAAVEFLLGNVQDLLIYNYKLLGDSKDEVEGLKRDLEEFRGFIKDSSNKNNEHQQALVNNIRAIVERAEDAIDTFILEMAKNNNKNYLKRLIGSPGHALKVLSIAKEVRSIREAVDRINGGNSGQKLQHNSSGDVNAIKRQKEPVVEQDEVIGFDIPANEIIDILREDNEKLDIVCIHGMAGLGKTTLAYKIFNDKKVKHESMYRAWAFVSKEPRIEEVFLSILKQLGVTKEAIYRMTMSELVNELKMYLEEKKYLIVLDDVWTTDVWDTLKAAFPNYNKRSRIVVTTRERRVAGHVNLARPPHHQDFLSREYSMALLERKVFGKSKCPENLLGWLGKVADSCGGLPLAIVVIAGYLLPQKNVTIWWKQVAASVNNFVVDDEKRFMEVIDLSFNSLSYNLKQCFLYLGFVPRGEFEVTKLIRLWIAEGLVKDEYKIGLENSAAAWLAELVDRNLVMAAAWRSNCLVKSCRVHDTLRVFCRKEAERQNLYHEINKSTLSSLGNYRRICVDPKVVKEFPSRPPLGNVRTFLTFSEKVIPLEATPLQEMVEAFKKIRVLEVSAMKIKRFPTELRELALLRYLAFSCEFKSIPSISKLWNLQTLVILTNSVELKFEEDIWKLYQLRHLKTNASAVLPPPPKNTKTIGDENMQTLLNIAPECCTKEVFKRTPNLNKLGVKGKLATLLENQSTLLDNFGELSDLTNLKLLNDVASRSYVRKISRKFSQKLPNLSKLTLSGTSLNWEYISVLGELEMLEVLKLRKKAFKGDTWEANYGTFPSLRLLCIDTTDLKIWKATEQQFNCLASLTLTKCDKLLEVPSCFGDMTQLHTLEINYCSKAVPSAREIQNKKATITEGQTFKLTILPPGM